MPCNYKHDFFVSYPHMPEDNIVTEFVEALVQAIIFLRTGDRNPEPVYLDSQRLQPGFHWSTELGKALCHSRAMLAVYTDDYFSREYCQAEWNAMLDLEVKRLGQNARLMIVPILFRAVHDENKKPALPASMTELQYEDFRTIMKPATQMKQVKNLQKVQRLLDRIADLRRQSKDPAVDCDTYHFVVRPSVSSTPATSQFGGAW